MKQNLIEPHWEIDKFAAIARDFSNPLSIIDKTYIWMISKDMEDFNNTISLLCQMDICRTIHPVTAEGLSFQVHTEYLPR